MAARDENVKILVVGPPKVGKSVVADFLSGTRDKPPVEYKETAGLRILETSLEGLNLGGGRRVGRGTRANVELWDVAGATRYQNCWPAIRQDADGVIFVFNPMVAGQDRELEFWHKSFAGDDIGPAHCLVFAHQATPGDAPIPRFGPPLATVKVYRTSVDLPVGDNFKEAFERLVERVLVARREKEESEAMKNDVMAGAVVIGAGH